MMKDPEPEPYLVQDPEPDPYLVLMDPEPGGSKTYGSGSATLHISNSLLSSNYLCAVLNVLSVTVFSVKALKVVTSEKIGGSGVTSTLGTWYGGVVMGVLLYFNEAAILYRDFNSAPSQKQNIIVFAANYSRCCECYVAPTIIL
jgi:hypothetical protein